MGAREGRLLKMTLAVATLAVATAACRQSNQGACRQYVEAANREYLACGYDGLVLNENETCPTWMDIGGADCVDYYDCLRVNTVCCTPERKVALEEEGRTCAEWEIDFETLDACTGCR